MELNRETRLSDTSYMELLTNKSPLLPHKRTLSSTLYSKSVEGDDDNWSIVRSIGWIDRITGAHDPRSTANVISTLWDRLQSERRQEPRQGKDAIELP